MHLGVMLAKSQAKEMQEGDVLFNLGDKGTSLFILLSGEVACIARDDTEVQVLEAGTFLSFVFWGDAAEIKLSIAGRCNLWRACSASTQQGAEPHNPGKRGHSFV